MSRASVLRWVRAEGLPLYFQDLLSARPYRKDDALWISWRSCMLLGLQRSSAPQEGVTEVDPEFNPPAGSELLNRRLILKWDLSRVTCDGTLFLCTLLSWSQPPATCIFQLRTCPLPTVASLSLPHPAALLDHIKAPQHEDIPCSQAHEAARFYQYTLFQNSLRPLSSELHGVIKSDWIALHCWLCPTTRFKAHEDFRLVLRVSVPVSSRLPFGNSFWVFFLAKELCQGSCVQLAHLMMAHAAFAPSFMDFRISLPLLSFKNKVLFFLILNLSFASFHRSSL